MCLCIPLLMGDGFWSITLGEVITGILMPAALYFIPIIHIGRKDYLRISRTRRRFLNQLLYTEKMIKFELDLISINIAYYKDPLSNPQGGYSDSLSATDLLQFSIEDLERAFIYDLFLGNFDQNSIEQVTDNLKAHFETIRRTITSIQEQLNKYHAIMTEVKAVSLKVTDYFNSTKGEQIELIIKFAMGLKSNCTSKLIIECNHIALHFGSNENMNALQFKKEIIERFYKIADEEIGHSRYTTDPELQYFVKTDKYLSSLIREFTNTTTRAHQELQIISTLLSLDLQFIDSFVNIHKKFELKKRWWLGQFKKNRPVLKDNFPITA